MSSDSPDKKPSRPNSPKSPKGSTNKLGKTRKELTELKILHKEDKKQWKHEICGIVRDKADLFGVMDISGKEDASGSMVISEEDFCLHFKGTFDDEMIQFIWKDLEKTDGGSATIITVHLWFNERRRPTIAIENMEKQPKKNEKWLFSKLKELTFVQVDDGRVGYLTKDTFFEHFKKEGINEITAKKVFNQIDADRNGTVSVMEFTKWQHNFSKSEFKSMHELPVDFKLDDLDEEAGDIEQKDDKKKVEAVALTSYKDKQRIWAKSVNSGKWRECAIIAEKRNKVKVHYLSFHAKHDEWLLTSSDRVSQTKPNPSNGVNIEDGDVVSMYSHNLQQWIMGEISNVKAKTNRVQISYLGIKDKQVWLQMDDQRISTSLKEPDEPHAVPLGSAKSL